jgi:putative addiction module component (TIGR02574 family)
MSTQISALLELSPDEKLDIIEALWESLSQSPELIPIHDWQKQELDRRQALYEANPEPFLTWEEVQTNILAKYG